MLSLQLDVLSGDDSHTSGHLMAGLVFTHARSVHLHQSNHHHHHHHHWLQLLDLCVSN